MKYLLFLTGVIGLNLLLPFGWLNLPYLVAVFVLVGFSFTASAWFVLSLLTLADALALRTLGFSYLLVLLCAAVVRFVYQRYLPHKRLVFVIVSVGGYLLAVHIGLFLSPYLL